ncbi:2-hydroxyacid dehydrogenase [Paeniglutamicibacter terrestris]|uniref:Hydroxyacid dehydrogenase n=1 Tax=Paeniglutamicibacter terrestris TaxID=2723403 RepID=A0ABX1G1J1_9MICC|nr:2-hydroxyacid dehydrogenase [Paeniglutamicibacter terrestris]ASN37966.1 hydroxyacid dehydrogenase [Arthrobacter sp. 7749]NKG19868.1 hydroxyacid dehydrogenase [Paeniglutamicibacter terrestris]
MRIVVTDPIISRFADLLQETTPGNDWEFVADLSPEEQSAAISRAEVLVCAKLSPEDAASCPARLVHITGSGADRVAVAKLPADTIVTRTSHHERSIAEHILMVVLAHQRRLLSVTDQMRAGIWRSVATEPSTAMHRTLDELTIGFVGLGGIGTEAVRLCTSLDMKAVAVRRNPGKTATADTNLEWVKTMEYLPELLAVSDVVVLCLPLTEETKGLMGTKQFQLMRSDALLVNVSRGAIIDEQALYSALQEGTIGGAALDVWWDAPNGTDAPESVARFAPLSNVIATPHYSGHALQTFVRRATEIAQNINAFNEGRPPSNTFDRAQSVAPF